MNRTCFVFRIQFVEVERYFNLLFVKIMAFMVAENHR